jgi:hypothetical protein
MGTRKRVNSEWHMRGIVAVCLFFWLSAVGAGLCLLWTYENTPSSAATATDHWPEESKIQPTAGLATLVMFAHPKCPCTRASIGELALIMARCRGKLKAHVLFLKPDDTENGWNKTDLWESAAAIPDVTAETDEGGEEARRFHSLTSGQALLYDANGRLLFSGGITGSRGHSGDNDGRSAIISFLRDGQAEQSVTSVFGCSLGEPICQSEAEWQK